MSPPPPRGRRPGRPVPSPRRGAAPAPRPRGGGDHRRSDGGPGGELGGEQVEGRRAVLELLRAGTRPVHELWVADGLEAAKELSEIEQWAARRKVRTLLVPRRRLESAARTEQPQGVLARARPLEEADLDDLAVGAGGGPAFLLVLDGITDPHNLGSLLRSAECAGVTGVVLGRHRAAHVTPTVAKVAAGAIEHVPIAVVPGVPSALARLSQAEVSVIGLDAGAPASLYELGGEADGPVALVLGAEHGGLAQLTRRRCHLLVSIPLAGGLESLNVASAGAVASFELARRRRLAQPLTTGGTTSGH